MDKIEIASKFLDAGLHYGAEKVLNQLINSHEKEEVRTMAYKMLIYLYTYNGEVTDALNLANFKQFPSRHLIELFINPGPQAYNFKNTLKADKKTDNLIFIGSQFNAGPCVKFLTFVARNKKAKLINIGLDGFHEMFANNEKYDCPEDLEKVKELLLKFDRGTIVDLTGYMGVSFTDEIRQFVDKKKFRLFSYLGFPNSIDGYEFIESSQLLHYTPAYYTPIRKPKDKKELIFACYSRLEKLSDETLKKFGDILDSDERIVLRFQNRALSNIGVRNKFTERLRNCGVNPCLVQLRGPHKTEEAYMKSFNSIHLLLDSYPYSGTTMTSDSLFMGCPVYCINTEGESPHTVMSSNIVKKTSNSLVVNRNPVEIAELYNQSKNNRLLLQKYFKMSYCDIDKFEKEFYNRLYAV